jgi:hypothetical protein
MFPTSNIADQFRKFFQNAYPERQPMFVRQVYRLRRRLALCPGGSALCAGRTEAQVQVYSLSPPPILQ